MKRIYSTLIIIFIATLAFSQNAKSVKQFSATVIAEDHYASGTTMDINFILDFQTSDFEYGDFISLTFPVGITPNGSPTNPIAITTEGQVPCNLNGVSGQMISWGTNNNDQWGGIEIGEHPFIVNVTIDAGVTGDQVIEILVSGSTYGTNSGDINITCTLQEMPTAADLSVVAGGVEYTSYPLAQASSFPFSAEVSNYGAELNTATDLVVTCALASYLETSAISLPLANGESEILAVPGFNPLTEGTHEVIFEANASGDPYLFNNSDTITFAVDSVYAHDDGGIGFSYGSQNLQFTMGAAFDIITEDDLSAVQFYLGEDAPVGAEFSLKVLPVTTNSSTQLATYGEPVWESENLNVDASMLDTWTTVATPNSELLEVGKYALLVVEHAAGSINLGFDGNPEGDILLSVNAEDHFWEDQTYGWPMVRLVLGTKAELANNVGVSAIVSPNSGADLSNAETVSITIMNYGTESQSDIEWNSYYIDTDGNDQGLETGTVAGPIAAGESVTFDLVGTADLSVVGGYIFTACTDLEGDEDATNDCAEKTVIHYGAAPTATAPSVGDGTEGNPYEIETLDNLYWLSQSQTEWGVGKYFIQTSDIDASSTLTWPDGKGFAPIGKDVDYFLGKYDGQGYTISDLTINRPDEEYVGLFGYGYAAGTTGGILENIGIIDANIIGKGFVGALVGKTAWTFEVKSCYADNVNITGSEDYVAGLVGSNHSAFIDYCWTSGTVSGRDRVGGLTGFHRSKTITNNYSAAVVNGSDNVGGLIGRIDAAGDITNSYSVGQVNGSSNVGGLIGSTAAAVANSYYDSETSGMTDTGKGDPKTTAEMMQELTFVNWDFTDIWTIIENTTYPTFNNAFANDVGISAIVSPNSGTYLSNAETVTITIMNFGTEAQSDIEWDSFYIDTNGDDQGLETGTVAGPIAAGESVTFDLVGTADLSVLGEYVFTATTYLDGDEDSSNDQTIKTVINNDTVTVIAAPTDFTAEVEVAGGNDVEMNWVAPGGVGYIQWDAGINEANGIGFTDGATFPVASRWLPSDLTPYDGNYMTSITFFPNGDPDATFILKVWTGENAGTEILSQTVASFNVDEFNEIMLDTPVMIDASQELWFGYEVTHGPGTFPAGCDQGPAVQGFGDMILYNGTWSSLYSLNSALDYNWNLAAYLVENNGGGKEIAKPMVKQSQSMASAAGLPVASGSVGTMAKMDKKGSRGLLGFNVYRDGAVIAEGITNTNYTDNDLLPGTYSYDVKAVYDEGISEGAGPIDVTILSGVDRNLVIVEVATGTWCQYCPGAAMGVDEMHEEGLSVGVIEYHSGDSYETPESSARIAYNEVSGFPTAVFDGIVRHEGGSATESLYTTYLPKYESRIGAPSLFEIDATYENVGGDNYQVTVDAEMLDAYPWLTNDIVLQVALTESHISESWQNQSELNFVCRDMIPTENGTSLDFAGSATQTVTLDFTIPSDYVMGNLELVVFIQDNTTKEILQGLLANYLVGIEDVIAENEIAVYPNPATDIVNISASMDIQSITVYNNVGQVISVQSVESNLYRINTANYESGIYLLQIETAEGRISKRIIIE